jgi:large subunit ribosomal protein L7/L12
MEEKIKKIVEEIENLTVIELNELIKILEEKFGPAVMPVQGVAPQAAGTESTTAVPSKVNVILVDAGANKIQVIKALREINPNLGLKEAKDIVDNPPQTIKENVAIEEANKIKEKIESAGGKVEFK